MGAHDHPAPLLPPLHLAEGRSVSLEAAAALLGAVKRECPDCIEVRSLEVSRQDPEVTVFLAGFMMHLGAKGPFQFAGVLSEIMMDRLIHGDDPETLAKIVARMSEPERILLVKDLANHLGQIE